MSSLEYIKALIKTKVLENMELGRILVKNNILCGCVGGKHSISFNMYPDGIISLIEGWSKNFATGAKNSSKIVTVLLSIWFLAGILICTSILVSVFFNDNDYVFLFIAFYIIYDIIIIIKARIIGNFNIMLILLYPIPLIFFFIIFVRSLVLTNMKHSVTWKGRKIDM